MSDTMTVAPAAERATAVQEDLVPKRTRLQELRELGTTYVLTEGEMQEQVTLERMVDQGEQILLRLRAEMAKEIHTTTEQSVQAAVGALAGQKRHAYEQFVQDAGQLARSWAAILALHRQQEAQVARLSGEMQEILHFPSSGELAQRLTSSMTPPLAWGSLLLSTGAVSLPKLEVLLDVDPGTRALPFGILDRKRRERQAYR
jgi:hypothetical protein